VARAVREAVDQDGAVPGRVPSDAATASASGLDPHISPSYAELQVARVARARGLTADSLRRFVHGRTEGRQFGLLGEPRVNVLLLNLALDSLAPMRGVSFGSP
jgi:K+-transporting ATPase ATPase C chain